MKRKIKELSEVAQEYLDALKVLGLKGWIYIVNSDMLHQEDQLFVDEVLIKAYIADNAYKIGQYDHVVIGDITIGQYSSIKMPIDATVEDIDKIINYAKRYLVKLRELPMETHYARQIRICNNKIEERLAVLKKAQAEMKDLQQQYEKAKALKASK